MKAEGFIPRGRLEGLTDGVFAFAMTLLALNLEFPDDLEITNAPQLLDAFHHHASDFLLYVISFFVLGRRWYGQARVRGEPEIASYTYMRWVLIHLFFITLIPFSTQVVGRYGLAPAIWLYAANTVLAALAAIRLSYLAERESGKKDEGSGRPELGLLIASSLLSVVLSFFVVESGNAMYAYFLNFAAPIVHRWAK